MNAVEIFAGNEHRVCFYTIKGKTYIEITNQDYDIVTTKELWIEDIEQLNTLMEYCLSKQSN